MFMHHQQYCVWMKSSLGNEAGEGRMSGEVTEAYWDKASFTTKQINKIGDPSLI